MDSTLTFVKALDNINFKTGDKCLPLSALAVDLCHH